MKKLTGILAPVPIFIDDKGKIDFTANKNACERLLKSEINGLFVQGTTGEFAYFSVEERKEYIKFLLEDAMIKAPMIICVSHWSTEKAVDLAKFAAQLGAKYISALLPTLLKLWKGSSTRLVVWVISRTCVCLPPDFILLTETTSKPCSVFVAIPLVSMSIGFPLAGVNDASPLTMNLPSSTGTNS